MPPSATRSISYVSMCASECDTTSVLILRHCMNFTAGTAETSAPLLHIVSFLNGHIPHRLHPPLQRGAFGVGGGFIPFVCAMLINCSLQASVQSASSASSGLFKGPSNRGPRTSCSYCSSCSSSASCSSAGPPVENNAPLDFRSQPWQPLNLAEVSGVYLACG